jgi:hypothetical protein
MISSSNSDFSTTAPAPASASFFRLATEFVIPELPAITGDERDIPIYEVEISIFIPTGYADAWANASEK